MAHINIVSQQQPDELVGRLLDGTYRIERRLGAGGMGAVYIAHHITTGQRYALKVLLPKHSADREALSRFRREAETVGKLGHAGIVGVHDFNQTQEEGLAYIVMDFLEGEDLDARLRARRGAALSYDEALHIFAQVGEALGAAHQLGIVHRDLKPANIFLAQSPGAPERAVILDFGLAKVMNPEPAMTQLTQTGMVMGTPQYMSPEQANGAAVDHRTDLYSLAAVFYEMLSNGPPLRASTLPILFAKLLSEDPPPLSGCCDKALPAGLDEVLSRALSKSPEDRYQSASELVGAVRALGPPTALSPGGERALGPPPPVREAERAAEATAPTLVAGFDQDVIQTAPQAPAVAAQPVAGSGGGASSPPLGAAQPFAAQPASAPSFPAPEGSGPSVAPQSARSASGGRGGRKRPTCLIVALVTLALFVTCAFELVVCATCAKNQERRRAQRPEPAPAEPLPPTLADGGLSGAEPPTPGGEVSVSAKNTSVPPPQPAALPDGGGEEEGDVVSRAKALSKAGRPEECLELLRGAGASLEVLKTRRLCALQAHDAEEVATACKLAKIRHPQSQMAKGCERLGQKLPRGVRRALKRRSLQR